MDKYFRTEQGERVNVVEHTLDQVEKWPNLRVYVGTDSQDYGGITRYVTAVVYRYGKRGAHYIYFKEEVPRVRDMYTRLYDEAVRTITAAQIIDSEIPISFAGLEFDYNQIPKWASNKLVSSIGGWAKGLNYRAVFKNTGDDIMMACKAADHICRK
jgi:predicted RNase H-related nuclease YkuK (DUF458 family)